jgi:hypothetical protein
MFRKRLDRLKLIAELSLFLLYLFFKFLKFHSRIILLIKFENSVLYINQIQKTEGALRPTRLTIDKSLLF